MVLITISHLGYGEVNPLTARSRRDVFSIVGGWWWSALHPGLLGLSESGYFAACAKKPDLPPLPAKRWKTM